MPTRVNVHIILCLSVIYRSTMQRAVGAVLSSGGSATSIAKRFNVPARTLRPATPPNPIMPCHALTCPVVSGELPKGGDDLLHRGGVRLALGLGFAYDY